MDIQKEFDEKTDPIVLNIYEICKFHKICPFKDKDTQTGCHGADPSRNIGFICDIVHLKKCFM